MDADNYVPTYSGPSYTDLPMEVRIYPSVISVFLFRNDFFFPFLTLFLKWHILHDGCCCCFFFFGFIANLTWWVLTRNVLDKLNNCFYNKRIWFPHADVLIERYLRRCATQYNIYDKQTLTFLEWENIASLRFIQSVAVCYAIMWHCVISLDILSPIDNDAFLHKSNKPLKRTNWKENIRKQNKAWTCRQTGARCKLYKLNI